MHSSKFIGEREEKDEEEEEEEKEEKEEGKDEEEEIEEVSKNGAPSNAYIKSRRGMNRPTEGNERNP
ncbi:hypothetical protein V1477_001820 [Vespula maculifrons]|uniref:Uncharacterized protein n=1 Tax=Vespula maculifrons TaxID=7453 RepID=A0ABD2CYB8_VESMC